MKPHWLIEAERELGVREIPGRTAEQRIINYWRDAGLDPAKHALDGDETPWCAVFVGAMLARATLVPPRFMLAKNFLSYGQKIPEPVIGCIVVLDRPGGAMWQGHVGFCTGADGKYIELLGGNQANSVSLAAFSRDRLAGLRWPLGVPMPDDACVGAITAVGHNPSDR